MNITVLKRDVLSAFLDRSELLVDTNPAVVAVNKLCKPRVAVLLDYSDGGEFEGIRLGRSDYGKEKIEWVTVPISEAAKEWIQDCNMYVSQPNRFRFEGKNFEGMFPFTFEADIPSEFLK